MRSTRKEALEQKADMKSLDQFGCKFACPGDSYNEQSHKLFKTIGLRI